jgi:hypothetical protein
MSHPVDEPGRQATHEDAGALRGPAQHVTTDDVRRRAHGQPHPGGPVLGEVGRDLGARVAGADDEDVAAGVRATVAVVAGQHEVAGEAVEVRPVGGDRGVVVAGGDDHVLGGERGAVVEVDQPPGAVRCGVAGRGVGATTPRARHATKRAVVRDVLLEVPGPPTGRTGVGSGSPAGPTTASACAGATVRSACATSCRPGCRGRRPGPEPHAHRARQPRPARRVRHR